MRIPLDRNGRQPLYLQIEAYLRAAIECRRLPPHCRLPATRSLAADLGVNRVTVENAYARLEADGLIAGRSGSGTYVLPPLVQARQQAEAAGRSWPWLDQGPIAGSRTRMERYQNAHVRLQRHPNPINLATGIGAVDLFPIRDFSRVMQRTIRRKGPEGLGYSLPQGLPSLRVTIAQILASQGQEVDPEEILITTGSQQAIGLVAQLLLRAGDTVLVENPTYSGALDLFQAMHLQVIGIPMDEGGMCTDGVEQLVRRHRPKLLYTIPNFHNPTSTCLDSHRRRRLLALGEEHRMVILEDDYVGDLRYDGHAQPSLRSIAPGAPVIYISTFSKMLMPDLRIGYLIARRPLLDGLVRLKCLSDLSTSSLMQWSLNDYLSVGRYQSHLRRCRRLYRRRRDAMVSALRRRPGMGWTFQEPSGGFYCWLRLPDGMDDVVVLEHALDLGLAFAPGSSLFLRDALQRGYLRLNFASHSEEEIDEGMQRLNRAVALAAGRKTLAADGLRGVHV